MLSPSSIRIKNHDNRIIEARCLPCSARRDFLRWRDEAWAILQGDKLSNRTQTANQSIQHVFDTNEEFRWLCTQMLSAHGIDVDRLDIFQVIELLFLSGEQEDGLLVKLQFPPVPPNSGKPLEPGEDPYYSLWASLAYSSGSWLQAKQTMDTLTYEEVIRLSEHLEKMSKERTPSPSEPVTPEEVVRKESIAQQTRAARQKGMAMGSKERAIDAIKKAVREKSGMQE